MNQNHILIIECFFGYCHNIQLISPKIFPTCCAFQLMLRWWFWIPGRLCIGRNLKRHAKPRTKVKDFNPLVKHSDDTPVNYHANRKKSECSMGKIFKRSRCIRFPVRVVERYNIQSTQAFKKSSPLMRQGFALFSPIAGTFFAVLFDHFFREVMSCQSCHEFFNLWHRKSIKFSTTHWWLPLPSCVSRWFEVMALLHLWMHPAKAVKTGDILQITCW